MAFIFWGETQCPICSRAINQGDRIKGFPAFVSNEADPLWLFNEAAVHVECLERHPAKDSLMEAMKELAFKTSSAGRKCLVCGDEITHPDELFQTPLLTGDPWNALKRFNFVNIHIRHVPLWKDLQEYRNLLDEAERSGTWKGMGLQMLKEALAAATGGPPLRPRVMRR